LFQTNKTETKSGERGKNSNRDSGICSSESADGKFGSLEISPKSPSPHPPVVHKDYSDSSLPRVSVVETGAIYTQVRKSSVTGSQTGPTGSKDQKLTGSKDQKMTGSNNKTKAGSIKEKLTEGNNLKMNAGKHCDIIKSCNINQQNDCKAEETNREIDESGLFLDFDTSGGIKLHREESLVDEIMSHLQTQMSGSFTVTSLQSQEKGTNHVDQSIPLETPEPDNHFFLTDMEMPAWQPQSQSTPSSSKPQKCQSSITDKVVNPVASLNSMLQEAQGASLVTGCHVISSSDQSDDGTESHDQIQELQTRLLQLRKDR